MKASSDQKKSSFKGNDTLYKTIFENILCGIAISKKQNIIFTNSHFKEISGYSIEEFNSLTAEERVNITHPDDYPKIQKYLSNLSLSKSAKNRIAYRIFRKDGKMIWIERKSSLLKFKNHELLFSVFHDFTEHKLACEEHLEVKDHLENLISYANAPIVEWDINYKITRFNKAFERITGRNNAGIIGKKINILFPKDALNNTLKNIRITKRGVRWENAAIDIKNIDGTVRTILWNSASIYSSDKKTRISTIAHGYDITKRVQAENELKNAFNEIKELRDKIHAENIYLLQNIKSNNLYEGMVGDSAQIKAVVAKASLVAMMDTTVLLIGETGTGKELLARGIHNSSPYNKKMLVTINCAAIPDSLIESELFGHEKGAFTDAQSRKIGLFEVANNSTIFLDEIAELPLNTQSKLLRVIENKEIFRLGGNTPIKVNARIIAATNQNLEKMVDEKKFRQDLFYRLNVYPIILPPLRMLKSDIPLLVEKFVRGFNIHMGKKVSKISKNTFKSLEKYNWPGNVRELRNIIERSMIQSSGSNLIVNVPNSKITSKPYITLEDLERKHIQSVLKAAFWKVSGENGAAEILGINPNTLVSKMKKLGIKRPSA